jgi:hypothetical protein
MRNRDWNGDGFTAARVGLASFLAQAGVSYRPEYGASPDFPRCLAAQTVHVPAIRAPKNAKFGVLGHLNEF